MSIAKNLGCKHDKEFAELLGVSKKQVSLWKRNLSAPRMDMLNVMIGLTGYTLDQCLSLPGELPKAAAPTPEQIKACAMIANEAQKQLRREAKKVKKKKQGHRRASSG